ncbi:C39 family peptidase [Desulfatitalea tepidiphila]|uniref:C39 family peptidase n=1 Tax=Desulfatitalea tepidiphila TaxID=1185843 RepID=UPI0006B56772|nr:C39 family peptidase [Desulfatitalea tepidiphila]
MTRSNYLDSDLDLTKGCVDDQGDSRYLRLTQNVPDGYVFDLQSDLLALGFDEAGEADGAFGEMTRDAVMRFQKLAGFTASGVVDRTTKDEIRLWKEHGHTKKNPPNDEKPEAPAETAGTLFISPRVPHYSQGDPRWAQRILGKQSSIARQGCAITCIAMVLRSYGRHVTPESLDEFLDRENGYSGDSVVWHIAGQCGQTARNKLKYSNKQGKENTLHAHLAKRVQQNRPTLVRVDYLVDPDIRYNHFVVCVGMTPQGEFIMNDPATRLGDGYISGGDENIIQKTPRKSGYRIVQLDWYDPVA